MSAVSSTGTSTTQAVDATNISSYFMSKSVIFPILPIIIGIVLVSIANTASDGNAIIKSNYVGGGAALIITGIAIAIVASGAFSKMKNFAGTAGTAGTAGSGGSVFILILAIAITIAIFVALFYSYSPPDVVPFASVILTIITVVGSVGLLYFFSGKQQLANTITRFVFSLYFFLPYAMFTFGVISDIITRRIEYLPASFTGITGVFLNFAISLFMNNGVPAKVENELCEIPGLSQLSSTLVPQPMMFTLSSIAYIATYISRSNIGGISGFVIDPAHRWPAWALYFGIYFVQLFVLAGQGCLTPQKAIGGLIVPLGWGGILGLIGFSVLDRGGSPPPPIVPGAPLLGPGGTRICPDGSIPGINGKCPELLSSAPTCSAGSGDGEFVCESFKNGKLETKVIAE